MANIPQKQQQAMLAAQKKDMPVGVGKGVNFFEQKNLSRPDEVRNFPKGKVDIVRLGDLTFGRFTMQPGWKWSESVKPIVKTEWCTHTHHIFIESGRMHIRMFDGKDYEGGPGDLLICPANHDAWTVGDEPVIGFDFHGGLDTYAKEGGFAGTSTGVTTGQGGLASGRQ